MARRPDFTLENRDKKYQKLCFQLLERHQNYRIQVVPAVTGCCGGGIEELRKDQGKLFDVSLVDRIVNEL